MYLHIGQNEILPDRRVIGIFDLDIHSFPTDALPILHS